MPSHLPNYVGFWSRVAASLVDAVLVGFFIWPLLTLHYGKEYWRGAHVFYGPVDFLLTWVFPAVAVIVFWSCKQATPGKMAISARVVDARTGEPATTSQYIIRYFGYGFAALPFALGVVWVAFDKRKQGWHDKLAKTVVIRQYKEKAAGE